VFIASSSTIAGASRLCVPSRTLEGQAWYGMASTRLTQPRRGQGQWAGGGGTGAATREDRVARASSEPTRDELYETLRVAPGTSPAGVKKAFKRLALRYHPDVCNEPGAEAKFREIQEAYDLLRAGGGTMGQRWWKYRWMQQLRRIRVYDEVKNALKAQAAEGEEDGEEGNMHAVDPVTPEEQRDRWQGQLEGLRARQRRREASRGEEGKG